MGSGPKCSRRRLTRPVFPSSPSSIPQPCTNDVYEAQMSIAVANAKAAGFTHVAFGDLFLEDIRRYREERMAGTGITPIFPLWRRPTAALAHTMLAGGLDAYLTCVDPRVAARIARRAAFRCESAGRSSPGHRPLRRARRVSHVRCRRTDVQPANRCRGGSYRGAGRVRFRGSGVDGGSGEDSIEGTELTKTNEECVL